MTEPTQSILPAWPAFARPTLVVLSDGNVWRTADLRAAVAAEMQLTQEQQAERLNSGQLRADNRVGWALSMLTRAQAVTKLRNGYSQITESGRQLLLDQPEEITEATLQAIQAFRDYVPKPRRDALTRIDEDLPAYWFVGAYYFGDDVEDQTEAFVSEGIWRNGYTDKYVDEVNSIEPGERIAIKAAYTRLYDIPFDNKGNRVSVMAIKATGTVTRNHGDGRTLDVDWDPIEPVREWYFYTNQRTVWKVLPGEWRTDGLISFAFEGAEQDVDLFRNSPYWADRFGDEASPTDTTDQDEPETEDEEPQGIHESYSLEDVVDDGCFIPQPVLRDYLAALRSKKNLILQGPPGTGKTWLAKRLGYALIGGKNRELLRAIQFHPTLSYEDFVRGWRPSGDGKLTLNDGIFLEIVSAAQADPGHDHVLVIEEVNRGNLAQIFGELLTLLEGDKRSPDEALELSYRRADEPPTYLPENLYIIGTMNLADRSLAIVDFALRRRFAFANLEPSLNDQWQSWVSTKNGIPASFLQALAQRVDALNDTIAEDRALGEQYRIGHSFFTPHSKIPITDPQGWLRRVVESELKPLLGEYWFDDPARVDKATDLLLDELP